MTAGSCEEARAEIEAFHYGDLERDERAAVEGHLGSCEACRAELDAVRRVAASLDAIPVPERSELDWARFEQRLEARIAPLRAKRMASSYGRFARYARVAAAFLIGGLGVLSAGLYARTRDQAARIDMLQRTLADSTWDSGDTMGAARLYATLARAPEYQSDPTIEARLRVAEIVADKPDLAKMWALTRQEVSEPEVRERIAEFLLHFPKDPLADQAFIHLKKSGIPRPPPLEVSLLRPVPFIPVRALPGKTLEATYRDEIAKLRGDAATMDPKTAVWVIFRAGRIADEDLHDAPLAAELYGEVLRRAPAGKLREVAKEGLTRLGAK